MKSARAADKFLERSLNIKFGKTDSWNFVNRTKRKDLLKNFIVSKVADRASSEDGKIQNSFLIVIFFTSLKCLFYMIKVTPHYC